MAIIRVRSTDGNDADNGSSWALAKATLAGAFAAAAAGDTIWVSHQHAETQASAMTLTAPGTAALPVWVICVNDGADPATTLATTATITTTGSNAITIVGAFTYYYGINFRGATSGTQGSINISSGSSVPFAHYFRNCSLGAGAGPTATAFVTYGTSISNHDDQLIVFDNTTLHFTHINQQAAQNGGRFVWKNTASAVGGTAVPTTLFVPTNSGSGQCRISGVDFSALGSGKTILNVGRGNCGDFRFRNCKLGASVSLTTGTVPGPGAMITEFINCDSADTNYRYWYQDYAGTIEQETTIVRTSGATDGVTPVSREMISSANASKFYPLVLKELFIWNETVGSSKTLTLHTITDNITLTNQDCWLEVEYLGTSGFPLSLFTDNADSLNDLLLGGTPANHPTSTATWTTTGLTTPVKQKLEVTVTPQEKGPIILRLMLARPNTTMYVCPKIEVS